MSVICPYLDVITRTCVAFPTIIKMCYLLLDHPAIVGGPVIVCLGAFLHPLGLALALVGHPAFATRDLLHMRDLGGVALLKK